MTIWEQNIEYLMKGRKELIEVLQEKILEGGHAQRSFQICQNRIGGLNIKIIENNQERFIHSNYNPDIEAERWAAGVDIDADLIIIYGLGLGYHIEKLIKAVRNDTRVIIIEPELAIFRLFLENRRLENLLRENVTLMINNNPGNIAHAVFAEFKKSLLGKVSFLIYSVYRSIYNDQFEAIKNRFNDILKVLQVNIATSEFFKKQWLANYLMNVFCIKSAVNGKYLVDKFNGIPAIIVSAGPSLNKNINTLKSAKNKALFLSAGSSFRILKKNGINPDFAVAIDGSPKIKDIYDGLDITGSDLIYINRTNYEVVQAYSNNRVLFIDSEDKLSQNLGKKIGIDFQIVPPDQTVAGVCVWLASIFGCDPIILVGQDFAYTGMELHAEGAAHMRNFKETISTNAEGFIKMKDIYGEDIYTVTSLLSSRTSMEDKITYAINMGHKFINATEGGIGVANCNNMNLKEVIEKYLNNSYNVGDRLREIYSDKKVYINIDNLKLDKYFEDIRAEAHNLIEKSINLNNICKKTKKELDNKQIRNDKYSKYALKINKLQQEIEDNDFYREIVIAAVEQSIAILKVVMEDNIKKSADMVGKNLARIEFISKQMMQIAEVCTFLETFVKNVYEPVYKDILNAEKG